MLLSKIASVFNIYLTILTSLRCVPFRWNAKNSVIKLYPSKGINRWISYVYLCVDIIVTNIMVITFGGIVIGSVSKGIDLVIPGFIYCFAVIVGMSLEIIIFYQEMNLIELVNKHFQTEKLVRKFPVVVCNES